MQRLLACVVVAGIASGCGFRTPAARPPATPPSAETSSQRTPRIAVVDLTRATRAHPRWPEMLALDRQIGELEAKIAIAVSNAPAALRIDVPKVDLTPEMKAAIERMRPEARQQAEAVKAAARKDLDAYVAQLRAQQQQQMESKRAEIEGDVGKAVQDKQQAIAKDNQQFQQQTMAEYRLPLLNLKLKMDNVQQSAKGETEQLSQRMQALSKERDDKIAAHENANQQAFLDFQKGQVQAGNARLKAYQDQLNKEGQQLVNARAEQLTADVRAKLEATQAAFNQRLRQQEQAIVLAARSTQSQEVQKIKAQAQEQLRGEAAKVRALQVELQATQRARAQLFAVILADLRVEAAALAQDKGWDLVLTRTIAAPRMIDATDDLIARLRR